MTGTDKVLLKVEGTLAMVVLNRPEAMNALNKEVWEGLARAASAIQEDHKVRVVILTGAGDRAFSAGLDIKAVTAGWNVLESTPHRTGPDAMTYLKNAFTAYENLPVPVIAAINGYCLGAAFELTLCCDIRIASETASFSLPEVQLGALPDMGSTQRLPRIVGPGRAKELIFTSRRIDAAEALRIGLVDQVYPKDKLMPEVRKLAEVIASHDPAIVQAAKRAVNAAVNHGLDAGLNYETSLAMSVRSGRGIASGAAAFLKEKEAKKK
jgi:enoyl-CoA hydratase